MDFSHFAWFDEKNDQRIKKSLKIGQFLVNFDQICQFYGIFPIITTTNASKYSKNALLRSFK